MNMRRVPVRAPDGFLIAMDRLMRRSGQGSHASQSILDLDRVPELKKLRAGADRLVKKHPLLVAELRRNWLTLLPYWALPERVCYPLPLGIWREEGAPGTLGPEAGLLPDTERFLEDQIAPPYDPEGRPANARLDVVELQDGRCRMALSWNHLLMDGKGAELLLAEMARLCEGQDLDCEVPAVPQPRPTFRERWKFAGKVVRRMAALSNLGVRSLGGPKPRPGRCCYEVITLSLADSATVRDRAVALTGSLFPLPFYLACAMRAHNAVFIHRRNPPPSFVAAVPVQMRRKGARGPIFNNHMSILFFSALQADLANFEDTAMVLKNQFVEMMRKQLDASFAMILEMMLRVPSWLYMKIVRLQFHGEISSFFHSHTGVFAPEMTDFAGVPISNANHLPCIGTPPGTGIFLSERAGQVNLTLSWREGCLNPEERKVMAEAMLADLLGRPAPHPPAGR